MSNEDGVRLQKLLSDHGIASRREAERMVAAGEVTVNGRVAKVGDKAIPGKDHVKVRGKLLQTGKGIETVVIALFKPRDMLSQRSDDAMAEKGTIFDLLPRERRKVLPIGRLDKDAEGIILLTNNGDLLNRLLQGKYEVPKVYSVKIDGHLDASRIRRLGFGVKVEDERTKPFTVEVTKGSDGKEWVRVTTTETRNRIVRKAFESVGRPVDKIRRDAFAGITLRGLQRSEFRYLTPAEVHDLKKWVGLA
jgi:23S rRNA pseudouridine2605 synthase